MVRVTLVHSSTGEEKVVWSIDASEHIATGEWQHKSSRLEPQQSVSNVLAAADVVRTDVNVPTAPSHAITAREGSNNQWWDVLDTTTGEAVNTQALRHVDAVALYESLHG